MWVELVVQFTLPCIIIGMTNGDNAVPPIFTMTIHNSFGIENAERNEVLGQAVYGAASLANHSCDSNSYYIFKGKYMALRSMVPLKRREQVTIILNSGMITAC